MQLKEVASWRPASSYRAKCFVIGYMHLVASVLDIAFHLLVVAISTGGFECDVDLSTLSSLPWNWIEPTLFVVNLGTHGFYPYPLIFMNFDDNGDSPKRCYPGMLHVNVSEMLNLMINMIWFRLVMYFVTAVHKRDVEPIRLFYGMSVMKLILQIVFFGYAQEFRLWFTLNKAFWPIKIVDIVLAAIFLMIIYGYIKELKREKELAKKGTNMPPSYVESLINSTAAHSSKDAAILNLENGGIEEIGKEKQ